MYYDITKNRIVCHFLNRASGWERVNNYETSEGMPARCTVDTPYFHIEFKVVDGICAGTMYVVLEIVECIDEDLVGKKICCEADSTDWGWVLRYSAENAWSDGFISNTMDESLGYYSYSENDGSGTPMGGEVIDDLDGMVVEVPDLAIERLSQNSTQLQWRSDKYPYTVGDVIVVSGRAGYDAPVPFAFASYVRGVHLHQDEYRLELYDSMRNYEINYYPDRDELGDGYSDTAEVIRHDRCGCDVIIRENKLIHDENADDADDDPFGLVANITFLIDDQYYDGEAPGGRPVPFALMARFEGEKTND